MNWFTFKSAKKGVIYEFSSVHAKFPKDVSQKIIDWGKENIPDFMLFTEEERYGRENEIHVTIKYGLHTKSLNKVKDLIADKGKISLKLGKTGVFETDKGYDVIVIEIESKDLEKYNKILDENLKSTDAHEYHPHCTIAFVKSGFGKNFKDKEVLKQQNITFDSVVFSCDGVKTNIQL